MSKSSSRKNRPSDKDSVSEASTITPSAHRPSDKDSVSEASTITPSADKKGQGLIEYGLIIALIAIAVIFALSFLGNRISDSYDHVTDGISTDSDLHAQGHGENDEEHDGKHID